MSVSDTTDFLRLSSGPLGKNQNDFVDGSNCLELDYDNDDDDDDGPPALQMSNEELAALQSRFRLECDANSDSDDSEEGNETLPCQTKSTPYVNGNGHGGDSRLTSVKSGTPSSACPTNGRSNDDSSCFPTDSMILENKTIYENMLHEDPNNQTNVDSWQAVNRPKYIARPEGWNVARPNDLVHITPEEYLALRSEPVGTLGDTKNITAFEMAGLLPSTSPASSASPYGEPSPIPPQSTVPEIKVPGEVHSSNNNVSVNIDYLLQPSDPASENTFDQTAGTNTAAPPTPPLQPLSLEQPVSNGSKTNSKEDLRIVVTQPDSGRDTDRQSPSSETPSYHSNSASASGSVSFNFNNGSVIADATDPDLAAVDAMLEMYDADVDPDELAEHIMMRFGVNPQRPGSTSGIFRDQDESLLRPPNRGGGLSLASVVSSTPKSIPPGQKSSSRPCSVQSQTSQSSRKVDTTVSSQVTLENVSAGRISSEPNLRVPSNEKRISAQSASPRSSVYTVTNNSYANNNNGGFIKPAKPSGIENVENNNRKVSPNNNNNNNSGNDTSNLSLSSFDASSVSEYGPLLTPMAEKGPFIRLEWDKLAIDLKDPVFVGQTHDLTLTAKNTGRLWVQLSATLQSVKIDGELLSGPKGLHILNSTVVVEPNAAGTLRFRFTPGDPGFYSANIDMFACIVGSVVEESRHLPPIPFSADVRLPRVEFYNPNCQPSAGDQLFDFGAVPAGGSRRLICSLRLQPPAALTPASSNFCSDVPVVVTIRPESAWRCFHFIPASLTSATDLLAKSKSVTAAPAPLYSAGHASKIYLSAVHQQHEFVVCFTARYDTELSPNQQGLELNEAELVAQTDSTPPRPLAVISLRAGVGIVSLRGVGLDQNSDDSTTLRMSCQLTTDGRPSIVNRTFFVLNSGSIAVDVSTNITSSPATSRSSSDGTDLTHVKMFSVQPSQFTLLPKQKVQITVKFEPIGLSAGEMCAGFLSFFTDPPQSGSPGQLPALDISLIGLAIAPPPVEAIENNKLQHAVTTAVPSTVAQLYNIRPALSTGSDSANSSASSANSNTRRTLVTSHQRVVWWGVEIGQSLEQIVNLRNVGSDEVSVRISIRDNNSDQQQQLAFVLGGSTSLSAPLLATLPPASDFPMRIIFRAQPNHQMKAAIAKMQIKVLASGSGSVPPGLKFCIPLFGAVGTAAIAAEGVSLRTTSAGHYYAIIGTVPVGARRSLRLTLRNSGSRSAFFAALPFADMSCTQRLGPSKIVCSPQQSCIAPNDVAEVTVDLFIGDREAALCAERSYIVACLQVVFGDNDLRLMAGRALSSTNSPETRRLLDEHGLELIRGFNDETTPLSGNLSQVDAWPEHIRLFSRHCRRLYVALVGEKTSNNSEPHGDGAFDEETLQHTMLLDDTQATIMFPSKFTPTKHDVGIGSISSLVEQRSNSVPVRPSSVSVAPSLPTVIDSPNNQRTLPPSVSNGPVGGIRLLPSELLLTALSDSRTLMLINDTFSPTEFEAEWAAHVLVVEPPRGTLPSNGTATVHVRLAPGAAAFVDAAQQQWLGRVGVRTATGHRLESVVRVHLSSLQPPNGGPPSAQRNGQPPPRMMQANRNEPTTQIVFGSRDCPHPPAARLDFGKITAAPSEQQSAKKLCLRLENEQPFQVSWQLEELSAYALASVPGAQISASNASSRCIPSIFSFLPTKNGNLPANGGQTRLQCVFQPPASLKPQQQLQDTNYLQHFLLTVKGTTGWTAETRISVVASVVRNETNGSCSTLTQQVSSNNASLMADQSQMSRISNSSTCSAAPLSATRRAVGKASSRCLVCPGEKHEFKKVVRPGESVKEKVNLENRSQTMPLHVEIISGPSLPFSTKHRRFTIEPMHYLHLPVVFKPVAPGSFRSEMTLHATTSSTCSFVPDEVLTISLLAQAGL